MARGSAPGERRGGRKKGTPNKRTAEQREQIAASGLTPLEYMLSVMRDEAAPPDRRDDMAKAAAPYVHPKLSAIEHSGKDGGAIEMADVTDRKRLAALAVLATKAAKADAGDKRD